LSSWVSGLSGGSGSTFENVQRGGGQVVSAKCLNQGILVDQTAAGRVDQDRAAFHFGQRPGVDQVGSLWRAGEAISPST
jgi:hypothetical protein